MSWNTMKLKPSSLSTASSASCPPPRRVPPNRAGLMFRHVVSLAVGLALSAAPSGCSGRPTYPKEHLAESLQQVLAGEHLETSVRFFERTLAVQLEYPDALVQQGNEIGIGPGFQEAARKVLPALHRALLSTDAEVHFYVLLLSDPHTPGAYLTMVRYIDDVRRAEVSMLNTDEMLERTVFDLNFVGAKALTIEQYVPRGCGDRRAAA